MKYLNLLFCFLLLNFATAQSVTFRCMEAEIFAKGCLTCDNSRTGKMITGIELNITGTKTEFINPCVVKYDSLDNISIIDYRNVVKTFKRSQTSYSTATALLKDLGKCTTPDGQPIIDTLQFVNDTLGISLYGDSVAMYKVKIPTNGSQKFDTIKYENDTLYLSLENDGVAVNKLKISSGTAAKIDTFDIVSDTIRISLNGDSEGYKKVNLKPYLDNTDNQALSLSAGKGTISITSGGSVTLADSSATNEIQTIDTFRVSSGNLELSLLNDGVARSQLSVLNIAPVQSIKPGSGAAIQFDPATGVYTVIFNGVLNGDRGDIIVTNAGGVWTIDTNAVTSIKINSKAVTYDKIQDAAAYSIVGRPSSTSGIVSDITIDSLKLIGRGTTGHNVGAISVGGILKFTGNTLNAVEAQKLDTASYSNDTLYLSISGDGEAAKKIKIYASQKDTAYYFPETYGAIVNDTLDDRAAIQTAIDSACARGGGIVWLRKGEYRIKTTASRGTYESGIHLCSNVYLMGTGFGSVINNKVTTSGKHIISLEHGGSNMTIQDLKIKSDSLPSGAAIYSNSGVKGVIVNHVQIDRGTCWGVFLKESSKCSILNSDIQNGGGCHCIELNNTNTTTVRNNWLYSNATKDYWPARGNGVEVFYDRNGTNRPYGNIIEANSIWGTGGGVVVWGDSLTTVSNNIIRLMEGHGIVVKRQDDALPYYKSIGTIVEGNIIHGTGYANNSSLGILVDYDGTDIVLNGNKLDTILCDYAPSGGGTGIEVRAAGTVVNNNSIRHCAINGITLSAEADYSSVTGNSILDVSMLTANGYKGISCSADNCTINSNTIHDLRGTKRMDICIYVPGNNNVVTSNNTSGAATGDNIYVTGTGNIEANNKD